MRNSVKLLAIMGLVLGGAMSFAQAQPQHQPQQRSPQDVVTERLKNLSSQLNLTDAQKEKIKPILQNEVQQIQTVREDTSLSREQKFTKFREIRDNGMEQIRPLLTDDQQKKLEALREQMKEENKSRMREHTPSQN